MHTCEDADMLVEEVMTKDVVTIDCNKTLYDACKVYSQNKVGCLVVMDKDIVVGIITERDMIERAILKNMNPNKTKVREIMSSNIKTIHALAPLEKAAQIMRENNFKRLPVILNNKIVGIITQTDLSRTIDAFSETVEEMVKFYDESKSSIEKIIDEWGNMLYSLKGHKKLSEHRQLDAIKDEIEMED